MRSKTILATSMLFFAFSAFGADQGDVKVEPSHLTGPRPLQPQTASAAVRDYLESWQAMQKAFDQNNVDLLQEDFTGTAAQKLSDAIKEQLSAGVQTQYQVRSHDIKIVFYSPDGLSIQIVDNVEFNQQISANNKVQASQQVHARYVVVLTPAEVRWRVRVFQAEPEGS